MRGQMKNWANLRGPVAQAGAWRRGNWTVANHQAGGEVAGTE